MRGTARRVGRSNLLDRQVIPSGNRRQPLPPADHVSHEVHSVTWPYVGIAGGYLIAGSEGQANNRRRVGWSREPQILRVQFRDIVYRNAGYPRDYIEAGGGGNHQRVVHKRFRRRLSDAKSLRLVGDQSGRNQLGDIVMGFGG